jgi:small-conductance mechanosensitive channel
MEQQIRAHRQLMEQKLSWLQAQMKKNKGGLSAAAQVEWQSFWHYHRLTLRHYQHERLAHLLVMLFFGLLVMVVGGMTLLLYPAIYYFRLGPQAVVGVWLLFALVVVTEGFYVKHYYFLENQIQLFYRLERQMFELVGL